VIFSIPHDAGNGGFLTLPGGVGFGAYVR
jgi:hypothetical protein